jgi:pimeloyl-ACP methyl ester carboxylesterase
MPSEPAFLTIQGRKLEVRLISGPNSRKPAIVFLHEALGSISSWRDFPEVVVARTGCSAIVYSRYGYGNSEILRGERQPRYMHDEALCALPELLENLDASNPILLGHSDGASIGIIYAGATATKGKHGPKALILLAPHVFVEDVTIQGIAAAKAAFETTDFPEKLARHHRDAGSAFWGWNHAWLNPDFRNWNIEEYLPGITCPVLVVQGTEDQYATMAQLDSIERLVPGGVERVELEHCRHSPHRDQPLRTVEAIVSFVNRLP